MGMVMNDFSFTPLEEGKVPPVRKLALRNGEWEMIEEYPEYDPEWEDPEIMETDTYKQEDKDEFYDYVTRCKACRTVFIAYDEGYAKVMNYCPGCGKNLV